MGQICGTCQGTRQIKGVFASRPIPCHSCLSEPDATGKRHPTGIQPGDMLRCPICEGGKTIVSMGGMSKVICSYCCGAGEVNESKIKFDVEQMNKKTEELAATEGKAKDGKTSGVQGSTSKDSGEARNK